MRKCFTHVGADTQVAQWDVQHMDPFRLLPGVQGSLYEHIATNQSQVSSSGVRRDPLDGQGTTSGSRGGRWCSVMLSLPHPLFKVKG